MLLNPVALAWTVIVVGVAHRTVTNAERAENKNGLHINWLHPLAYTGTFTYQMIYHIQELNIRCKVNLIIIE